MSITSVTFLLFFAASFAIFYICPLRHRWKILLVSSIVFYAIAGIQYLPFIAFTTLVVWLASRKIGKLWEEQDAKLKEPGLDRSAKKQLKATYKKHCRSVLILALILGVGLLALTKFMRYLVAPINQLLTMLQTGHSFSAAWIIVPLGISYYTFSTVGYLLDVYWKRYPYEPSLARFALYAIYFPHIVQGPISRYNLLGQELKKELRFDSKQALYGFELMLWGYFKKIVIADRINVFVGAVYDGNVHSGLIYLIAILLDAVQIYTDFSGYTDIVRGASQVFGIQLEQNFNHPFFSKNVPEFWRRWHMTMGGWFKDYVYYPINMSGWLKDLNKNTKGKLPDLMRKYIVTAIPILITWFLTGLWHGTGKTYVAWGIYYGILIVLSNIFTQNVHDIEQKLHIHADAPSFHLLRMVKMFFVFCGGRLLTRPGSLHWTLRVLKNVFTNFQIWQLWDGTLLSFGLKPYDFALLALCILVLWTVSMLQERGSVRDMIAQQNLSARWFLLYAAIFAIIIFGWYGGEFDASAFIYQQY